MSIIQKKKINCQYKFFTKMKPYNLGSCINKQKREKQLTASTF